MGSGRPGPSGAPPQSQPPTAEDRRAAAARAAGLGRDKSLPPGKAAAAKLVLDTGDPPAAPAAAPPAGVVTGPPGPAGFGDDEDDEWEEQASLDVALDMGSVRPPASSPGHGPPAGPGVAGPPPAGQPAVPGAPAEAAAEGSQAPRARPPKVAPAAPAADLLGHPDELAVRQLAGYGLVPENILGTLPYAWRVYRRRKELKALHAEQQQTHREVSRGLREQMAGLVDEATAGLGDDHAEVQSLLAPIAQCDQLIEQRSKTLDAAASQYSAQVVSIDKELAGIQEARQQASQARSMAQIKLEDALQKRSQAQATVKRLDERIQAAHDAARAAAAKGADFAPPEHARQIKALQAKRGPLAQAVEAAEAAVAQAQGALREADRGLRDVERKLAAAQERRRAVEKEAGQAQDVGFKGLREAQERRLDAYQNVLAALSSDHPDLLTEALTRRVNDVSDGLARADEELERHRLAIDAYDKPSFQRGLLIAAALGVVLLLILVTMARVSGPGRTDVPTGLTSPADPAVSLVGSPAGRQWRPCGRCARRA